MVSERCNALMGFFFIYMCLIKKCPKNFCGISMDCLQNALYTNPVLELLDWLADIKMYCAPMNVRNVIGIHENDWLIHVSENDWLIHVNEND